MSWRGHMAKLSASTEHALSVVAHALMAKGMQANVAGMSGFYDFWLKEQTSKDREIVEQFKRLSNAARSDLASMLKKDIGNG
jgi:hypothetical protein